MAKIIEYRVIQEDLIGTFTREVNAFIDEGWQPYGGISVSGTTDNGTETFHQAMVKYQQPPAAQLRPIEKTNGLGDRRSGKITPLSKSDFIPVKAES